MFVFGVCFDLNPVVGCVALWVCGCCWLCLWMVGLVACWLSRITVGVWCVAGCVGRCFLLFGVNSVVRICFFVCVCWVLLMCSWLLLGAVVWYLLLLLVVFCLGVVAVGWLGFADWWVWI